MSTGDRQKASKSRTTGANSRATTRPPQRGRRPDLALQRLRLIVLTAIVVLLGVGALVTWMILRDDEDSIDAGVTQQIAKLDTPDVHSLLIDPSDPDHILFGSHAGIMESRDGGFTWQDGTLQGKDAMSMSRSPQDPSTIYVMGHDVLEVSRDGGATWQSLQHDLPGTDVHAFAQDPLNPPLLFAFVVGHGIFTSENAGANWESLKGQPAGGGPYALAADGTQVFAATQDGIISTTDQGATWQPIASRPSDTTITLAISPTDPKVIYAGTPDGVARSADGGASWTIPGPSGVTVLALAVAPSDPLRVLFVAQGGGVYRSDDGGLTWRERL